MLSHRSRITARSICAATAFLAVGAAGATAAAPANAALAGIAVQTPAGYGSSSGSTNYNVYGAGCAYELEVIVNGYQSSKSNLKVTSVGQGRATTIYDKKPTSTAVTPIWRPSAPGRYVLTATLDGVTKTRSVNVGTGVQLPGFVRGGACYVIPIY